jgi:hypothetical protein
MGIRGRLMMVVGAALAFVVGFGPPAQTLPGTITLAVSAGFDGYFRESQWLPVFIRVSNDGNDIDGALVVRPETSGNGINNTFTVPISLPTNSRKTAFLYVTARSFATQLRVDLVDNEGQVITNQSANLRSVQPPDQLHVVISQSTAGTVDLTGVHTGGHNAYQAFWSVDNIPDRAAGLDAVNMMLFSDVDTGTLTSTQRQALSDWVAQGGHLLVTGGTNWQATAAGLTDLLPIQPDASATVEDMTSLARWGDSADLVGQTVVSTGNLIEDAQILASTTEDVPLLARRSLGVGTVDYVTADPGAQPMRGWGGLTDLWFTLATTVPPRPAWTHAFFSWDNAADAVQIFPGYNILPEVLPLCGFLAAYIALVGPLNYVVLNRINRREYAWVTIPAFIILFSVLAWVTGFNLRGNDARLSRLSIVQSWPDSERAAVEQVMGLLSPRRTQYSLAMEDGSFLRPITRADLRLLSGNLQVSTDIQQTDVFRAADFSVDASIIASFNASGVIEQPPVSGQATFFYEENLGQLRGSVRNNGNDVLTQPVILARGVTLRLDPLEPGEVATFDLTIPNEGLPSPSPMADVPGSGIYGGYPYYANNPNLTIYQSIIDVLGESYGGRGASAFLPVEDTPDAQEQRRRALFLDSFMRDYYFATGRGNRAYLAAWSDTAALPVALEGAGWTAQDTTLYIAELDVEFTPPAHEVTISADQFTWVVRERLGLNDATPLDISLQPGDEVTFRFTPLPDAVLSRVKEVVLEFEGTNSISRQMPVQLWDWQAGEWREVEVATNGPQFITNPARFLGPQNAMEIRIIADELAGYARLQNLTVEHVGVF